MVDRQPGKSQTMEVDGRSMEEMGQVDGRSMEEVGQFGLGLGWTGLADGPCLRERGMGFFPIYFGVTCAFAAINLLVRRKNMQRMNVDVQDRSKAVEGMLKGAGQLLGLLVWKAQSLIEEKRDAETWELEKDAILIQVAKAEADVAEMKKRRAEDAKANEKVVAMFATQENNWKAERKKLKQQMEAALNDLQALQARTQGPLVDEHGSTCSQCTQKEQMISELNEKIREEEFLVMATVEAADADQQKRRELEERLGKAESTAEELRQKLSNEIEERDAEFQRHKAAFIDFVSNQRHMEVEMGYALRQLEAAKRECEILLNEKNEADTVIENLSLQIAHLQNDVQEEKEAMSAMLKKANADAEERYELAKELKMSKAKRQQAEFEAERWRRICERKTHGSTKESWRPRSSSASRADSSANACAEMKSLQAEEIKKLHINYIKKYQQRIAELEEIILLQMAGEEIQPLSRHTEPGFSNSGSRHLEKARDSRETDIAAKQLQLPVAENLCAQIMDRKQSKERELGKRKKLYVPARANVEMLQRENDDSVSWRRLNRLEDWIDLEKTRNAVQLEHKHWQEVDAFVRQMRIKDEQMQAFRWQLVIMEQDSKMLQSEIENLHWNQKRTTAEKTMLESLLVEKDHELKSLKERLNFYEKKCDSKISRNDEIQPYGMDADAMCFKVKAAKNQLREKEQEDNAISIKILEEVEKELQEKDYMLAVVEAKLIQTQMRYKQERKAKQRLVTEIMRSKCGLNDCVRSHVTEQHEACVKNAIDAACLEVERLSEKIAEARDRMMQMEIQHEEQLKDLIEQATRVSRSGCQLRSIKNLLQTAEEKIEKSAECNVSHPSRNDHDISVLESHEKANVVDKHVSAVVQSYSSNETCDLVDVIGPCAEGVIKPVEFQAGCRIYGDCQNEISPNSLHTESEALKLRTNGLPKDKRVSTEHFLTPKAETSIDEGHSEKQTQSQTFEQTMTHEQSIPVTKVHGESYSDSLDTSSFLKNVSEGRGSSCKKDAQALAISSKVKKLEQQLLQLEKMSKIENWLNAKDVVPIMVRNTETRNENQQVQPKWSPISSIHVLKKQVKRYQSLTAKIDDLCNRMYDRAPTEESTFSFFNGKTREETLAQELFLIETFQLQRYVVATGQKLMAIQSEIAHDMYVINDELASPAILNLRQSIETVKGHLREVQRSSEVRIASIIGDLEGILACKGILHVSQTES